MVHRAVAVFLGIGVQFGLIMGGEALSHGAFPPPAGMDFRDPKAVADWMGALPAAAFLSIAGIYAVAACCGGWVATRLHPQRAHRAALWVGALGTAGAVANTLMLPHPAWFSVVTVGEFLPMAWVGGRLAAGAVRHARFRPGTDTGDPVAR